MIEALRDIDSSPVACSSNREIAVSERDPFGRTANASSTISSNAMQHLAWL